MRLRSAEHNLVDWVRVTIARGRSNHGAYAGRSHRCAYVRAPKRSPEPGGLKKRKRLEVGGCTVGDAVTFLK